MSFLGYCSMLEFHRHVREAERTLNAGACTQYDSLCDHTVWAVAGKRVGITGHVVGSSTWYKIVLYV